MKKIFSQEGVVTESQNRIIGSSWNLVCPLYKMGLKSGQRVTITLTIEEE